MKNVFEVTDHGLQVDKTAILPGSTLILSRPAPGHWARFGKEGQASEKEMVVATPEAASGEGQDAETDQPEAAKGTAKKATDK